MEGPKATLVEEIFTETVLRDVIEGLKFISPEIVRKVLMCTRRVSHLEHVILYIQMPRFCLSL